MFSVREDIAAALNGAGADMSPEYRQSLAPYTGFVKWNGRNRDSSGFGWIDKWQVWIALPQDVKTAERWLAEHLDALLEAASTELVVTASTPAELLLDGNKTNGLIIDGSRAV